MAVERITAGKVAGDLHDHLQRHENKLDPKLHNLHIVVFGEKGDDGLVKEVDDLQHCYKDIDKRLNNIEGYIKWLILLVMGSLLTAVWNMVVGKI